MNNKFDNCPYCGRTVIKGAMRCVACGRPLQTPAEQVAIIERLQGKNRFNIGRLVNYAVIIALMGVAYYYSERIIRFLKIIIKDIMNF
ncbi:MAG: hypothetical protein AB1499_06280 [Nitrospirota bacterium]